MLERGQAIKIDIEILQGTGVVGNVFVEEEIGKGEFGIIWKVRHGKQSGQYYALEHLDNEAGSTAELRTQLQKTLDGQMASTLFPKVHALIELEDGSLAIFGEYYYGVSLSEWLSTNQTRPWASKKDVFIKILHGVRAIQQKETTFLFNPGDIFISSEGQAILMEQGLLAYPKIERAFSISHQPPEKYGNGDWQVSSAMRGNVFVMGCLLYSFIKGDSYWNLQGYETPPYAAMEENGQLKDSNILDSFDQELEYPAEAVGAIRIATSFQPEKRFNNTDSFLRHFNQEAIPEVENIPIAPTFKAEPKPTHQPQPELVTSAATDEPTIQRASPKYKVKKSSIAAAVLGLLALLLVGTFMFKSDGDKRVDIPLDEAKDWTMAKEKHTEYYYRKYLAGYPDGQYGDWAFDLIDSIYSDPITEADFLDTRFTGKYSEAGDTRIFSMRFTEVLPNEEVYDFKCDINMGTVRSKLIGSIDSETFVINFEQLGDEYAELNILNGRIYNRDGRIFIESTDVDQYWNLRD